MNALASIRFKIFAGLMAIVLTFVGSLFYLRFTLDTSSHSHQVLNHIVQLELAADTIKRRAANYKQNAPRDFESYFRDVAVFYQDFQSDLASFDALVQQLKTDHEAYAYPAWAGLIGLEQDMELQGSVGAIDASWKLFQAGFQERIGADEREPRLEWGVEYILEDSPQLFPMVDGLSFHFRRFLGEQAVVMDRVGWIGIWVAVAVAFLVVLWFQFGIVQRLRTVADGCRRVALGEFGYQMRDDSRDELGQLVGAFNSLSSRARLVMSTVNEVQGSESADALMKTLWEESQDYLQASWIGVAGLDERDVMSMQQMYPGDTDSRLWSVREPLAASEFNGIFKTGEPLIINDLNVPITQKGARGVLSALRRSHGVHSLLAVPLVSEDGWRGVLLFGHQEVDAYDTEQATLMGNLGGMLAQGLESHMVGTAPA